MQIVLAEGAGGFNPLSLMKNPPFWKGTTSVVPQSPKIQSGLYRLRKNSIGAAALKGHGFIRADKANIMIGL